MKNIYPKRLNCFYLGLLLFLPSMTLCTHKSNPFLHSTTEQWKKIQKLLLLSANDVTKIKEKVGIVSSLELNRFLEVLCNLLSWQVTFSEVLPSDALKADLQHHELLFENEYIRILWATLNVGETSHAHTHQWPSILLTTSAPTSVIIHKKDGTMLKEEWNADIEEIPAEMEPLAFTNCGPNNWHALVIELKQTLPKTRVFCNRKNVIVDDDLIL